MEGLGFRCKSEGLLFLAHVSLDWLAGPLKLQGLELES